MHGPIHTKFDVLGFIRCQRWPAFKTQRTVRENVQLRNVEDGGIYSDHCGSDGWAVRDVFSANCRTTPSRIRSSTDGSAKRRKGQQSKINTKCLLLNRHYTVNRTNLISRASVHITDSKEYKHFRPGQARPDKGLRVAAQERYSKTLALLEWRGKSFASIYMQCLFQICFSWHGFPHF